MAGGLKYVEICCCIVLVFCMVSSTNIPWRRTEQVNDKTNDLYSRAAVKRYGPSFRSNFEVRRYLKYFGQDLMIWRCKNAIKPYWDRKPIPLIELYCETIGSLSKIEWFHNGKNIELGGRFVQNIVPHFAAGQFFSSWIDFKLKIYNATQWDSGVYKFRATNAKGDFEEEQVIYVDISERRRKKSPQGDYHDYGKVKKSERKYRRRKNGSIDEVSKKAARRLRRKNRKKSQKKKIWDRGTKLVNEPK